MENRQPKYRKYRNARSLFLKNLISLSAGVQLVGASEMAHKRGIPTKYIVEQCLEGKLPHIYDGERYLVILDHRQGNKLQGGKCLVQEKINQCDWRYEHLRDWLWM